MMKLEWIKIISKGIADSPAKTDKTSLNFDFKKPFVSSVSFVSEGLNQKKLSNRYCELLLRNSINRVVLNDDLVKLYLRLILALLVVATLPSGIYTGPEMTLE